MSIEEMAKAWFDEETKVDEVTLKEFDEYVLQYLKVRAEADALEDQLTEKNKILQKMSDKLISYLEAQGKAKHETALGSINWVSKEMWKPPEGEGRENTLQYLKDTGQYEAVMAFNANKFHAWFKQEKENNPEFDLPGVHKNITNYIRFTRKKG